MRDIQLDHRTERSGDKVRHRVIGERAAERKQPVAIDAERRRLRGTNEAGPEPQLMRSLGPAEVVRKLPGLRVHETGRGEPTGALEVSADIDVRIVDKGRWRSEH